MNKEITLLKNVRRTAWYGLGVQILVWFAAKGLSRVAGSPALEQLSLFAFAGLVVWGCQAGVSNLLVLAALAREDSGGQVPAGEPGQLDETGDKESAERISPATRLTTAVKYMVPAVSIGIAVYLMLAGYKLLAAYPGASAEPIAGPASSLSALALSTGLAFLCFVAGRYFKTMEGVLRGELFQSGTVYLSTCALLSGLTAVALVLSYYRVQAPLRYLGMGGSVLAVVVGAEIVLFFLVDMFRPRRPGEIPRFAYDSRLLFLITRPGSVGSAISDTVDYQLGFKVSKGWVFHVLGRSAVCLVFLSCVSLLLLSCLVIVEPHQQALVTRFGRITGSVLGPGLHLKAPWPVDIVKLFDTAGIRQVHVGSHRPLQPGGDVLKAEVPVLWTNQHGLKQDEFMIVAPPSDLMDAVKPGGESATVPTGARKNIEVKTPSVSLVGADVCVGYRITDLAGYVKNNCSADQVFAHAAELDMSRELFRYDIDAMLGSGRTRAAGNLRRSIQSAADRLGLGLRVEFVHLIGVHPPQEVADTFQETVTAEQLRITMIQQAETDAIRMLTEVAGTRQQADELIAGIESLESDIPQQTSAEFNGARSRSIEEQLRNAGGVVAEKLAKSIAYRWNKENSERSKSERFRIKLKLHQAAPLVYRMSFYLKVLEDGLKYPRKFMVVGDREKLVLGLDCTDFSGRFREYTELLDK